VLVCLPILINAAAVASPSVGPVSPAAISGGKASAIQAAEKADKKASQLFDAGGNYPQFITDLQVSLELWKQTGEAKRIQQVLITLGTAYWVQGDLRNARKIAAEALKDASNPAVGPDLRISTLMLAMGIAKDQGDHKAVIRFYQELIGPSQGNKADLRRTLHMTALNSLAILYGNLGDFSAQRQSTADARQILRTNHAKEDLTSAWFSLLRQEAVTLFSQGEINKAVAIFEEVKAKLDASPSQANLKEFATIRVLASHAQTPACPQQAETLQRIISETQLPEKDQPVPSPPETTGLWICPAHRALSQRRELER
jgi:tetratricopeptide (TPR) repeat protein